jgi:hypothetical protein
MADERIEVEWIATANKMVQVLDRLEGKFDKQERQLEKLTTTSKKNAEAAAGSFNALEQELKQAEAALKGMAAGTDAFAAQKKKVDALRDSLKQAKSSIQGAAGGFGQTLSAGVGQIQNMVAGMFTLQAVVAAISSELEKVSQLRLEAAQQSRTFEDAARRMTLNVGAENAPRAQQMVLQQAPLLGVDPSGLADMIGAAISGGAKDVEEAMRLSSDVLKLTAGNVQDAMPILSGMLTIAGATGNRDFQAIMGQLSQFQAAGRGGDLAQTINNLSTSLAAVNTRGERIQALGSERTLELAATISQILQDERGAITGTTLRQLMQRMDMFVAKPETKLDDGTVSRLTKAQVEGFNQLGTLDDRIAAMRATPELAKQFLSTLEINEGTAAIRQIVTGDVNALQEEQKAAALIGGQAAGKQEFEQLTGQIADQTKLSRAQAKSEAVARVGQIQGGRSEAGQVASTIAELFKTVNLPGIDMITSRAIEAQILAREQIGQSPAQAAIETLQGALLGPEQSRRMAAGMPTMEMSAADKDQVVKQIKVLEDLRAEFAAMRQQPLKVQAPPMRPKEAPLPAATAP